VATPLGVAVGFLIPAIFVDDSDLNPVNREKAKKDIFDSLLCQAILGTLITALVCIFFREKPPTPPSASAV
jgi:hypothetical protein